MERSDEPSPCATIFMDGLRMTAHIAAFFNLCLIAVDMHVAILHPLRYSAIIDSRRVKILVSVSWSLAFLLGFSALYVPSKNFSSEQPSMPASSKPGNASLAALRRRIRPPMRNDSALGLGPSQALPTAGLPFDMPLQPEPSQFETFCYSVFAKEYDSLFAALGILILAAILMMSIYSRIFCTIKRIHKTDDETAKNYNAKARKSTVDGNFQKS